MNTKTENNDTAYNKSVETNVVLSFRPSILQFLLKFAFFSFLIYLSFNAFDIRTITGISMLSISSVLLFYFILSIYTTKYLITQKGVLFRRGPFSRRFKEIYYGDINSLIVKQGRVQKLLKIGNLTITTEQMTSVFKGIKRPYQIKELISKEKTAEYERRTLLKKML